MFLILQYTLGFVMAWKEINTRGHKQMFQAEEQTELQYYVHRSISHFLHILDKLQNLLILKNILNYISS